MKNQYYLKAEKLLIDQWCLPHPPSAGGGGGISIVMGKESRIRRSTFRFRGIGSNLTHLLANIIEASTCHTCHKEKRKTLRAEGMSYYGCVRSDGGVVGKDAVN
jgi:hypothetical protein